MNEYKGFAIVITDYDVMAFKSGHYICRASTEEELEEMLDNMTDN